MNKNTKWTYETCLEVAKKCKTKSELKNNYCGAYNVARKNKWIDDYTWFKVLHKKISFKEFKEEVLHKIPHYFDDIIIINETDLIEKNSIFSIKNTNIILQCKKDGYTWNTNGKRILLGNGCLKCSGSLKKTHEEFINELKEKQPELFDVIDILDKYETSKTPLTVRCKKCGYIWYPLPYNLLIGKSKCKCQGGKVHKLTKQMLEQRLEDTNWILVDGFIEGNLKAKSHFKCKKCGEVIETTAFTILTQGYYCPSCDEKARYHTSKFYENKIKDKFNLTKASFKWDNVDNVTSTTKFIISDNGKIIYKGNFAKCIKRKNLGIINKNSISDNIPLLLTNLNKKNISLITDINDIKTINTTIQLKCNKCGLQWETIAASAIYNTCGCRRCQYANNAIINKAFLKEDKLQLIKDNDLVHMSCHQLIELSSANVFPSEFKILAFSESGSDKRKNMVSELRDEYEDNSKTEDEITNEIEQHIHQQNEHFINSSNDDSESNDSDGEEVQKSLPSIANNMSNELMTYDKAFVSYGEKNKYIAEEEVHKIWNTVLTDETYVHTLENLNGSQWLEYVKELFYDEYNKVITIKADEDYKFKYEPSLMQKLMVYKMLTNNHYCNWCGTGAGKTNAFLMATRATYSHNVVCVMPKSVVDDMNDFSINAIYPNSNIIVYNTLDDITTYDASHYNYILINYEKFQLPQAKEMIEKLVKTNKIDFICFDELHKTKVRGDEASIRSENIKYFRMLAAESNPNIKILGMTATPLINNLTEVKNLLELVTGEKYDEIGERNSINNIHIAYKQLILNGFRYVPNYKIGVTTTMPQYNGDSLKDLLVDYRNSDVNGIEGVFVNDKMDLVRDSLKPHTIIYTNFIKGIVPKIKKKLNDYGISYGMYTGNENTEDRIRIKDNFVNGKFDVLIASSPISTGVDGLQKVCNNIIIISLPWTNAEYTQLVGRINRQGSSFDNVNIIIPQVYITLKNGTKWSWDKKRYDIIAKKKTLSDAVVDGYFSELYSLNRSKLLKDAIESLKNGINDFEHNRDSIELELPSNVSSTKEYKESVICNIHQRASTSKHSSMHDYFTKNPSAWTEYHRVREENKKEWNEDPLDVIAEKINAIQRDMVIADLGCGMNTLKDKIHYSKMYSVDHFSNDEKVIKCDMADLSEYINDGELDCAVFCLSLWGIDYMDYIKEAYRMLSNNGLLYIAEPNDKVDQNVLINGAIEIGFKIMEIKFRGSFTYIRFEKAIA